MGHPLRNSCLRSVESKIPDVAKRKRNGQASRPFDSLPPVGRSGQALSHVSMGLAHVSTGRVKLTPSQDSWRHHLISASFWVLTAMCRAAKMKSAVATCVKDSHPGCKSLFPKPLLNLGGNPITHFSQNRREAGHPN